MLGFTVNSGLDAGGELLSPARQGDGTPSPDGEHALKPLQEVLNDTPGADSEENVRVSADIPKEIIGVRADVDQTAPATLTPKPDPEDPVADVFRGLSREIGEITGDRSVRTRIGGCLADAYRRVKALVQPG